MTLTSGPGAGEIVEYTPDQLPTYQDALGKNLVGEVPSQFKVEQPLDYGTDDLDLARYTSCDFHLREVEKVWKKAWQFACFADDIPKVGDYLLYEIAGISIIVSRSAPDTISAFYNACLHRASALTESSGSTGEFMCPYHGWRYGLDGTLTRIPAAWDFPNTCPGKERIPAVQAEVAFGMVFVNLDPTAQPLAEFLHPLLDYVGIYPPMDERMRVAWVRKVVPVNWKSAQEAYMEGYHLASSHPQLADTTMCYEMQYDGLGQHITRLMAGGLSPNWMLGPDVTEQEMFDRYTDAMGMPSQALPEGVSARAALAGGVRQMMQAAGVDLSAKSDPEVIDSPLFFVWPNIVIWGGYAVPWIYRFRPNGNDHNSAIMEIFSLSAAPPGIERAHVPVNDLGDRPFSEAPELGFLGPVLDQDFRNLALQEIGSRSTPLTTLRFSRYQESLIRHHHHVLDRYLDA